MSLAPIMHPLDLMVLTLLKIVPMAGKRDVLLEILHSIEDSLRGRTACIDCGVFEQPEEERAILYFDQWLSLEDLSVHVRSELYLRMLVAMELAERPPEVNFHEIAVTKELTWVKAQRVKGAEPSSLSQNGLDVLGKGVYKP
jgi:quinol monooxygenase YgiN